MLQCVSGDGCDEQEQAISAAFSLHFLLTRLSYSALFLPPSFSSAASEAVVRSLERPRKRPRKRPAAYHAFGGPRRAVEKRGWMREEGSAEQRTAAGVCVLCMA